CQCFLLPTLSFVQTLKKHLPVLSFAYFILCANVKKPFASAFFCLLFFRERKVRRVLDFLAYKVL
ncbi:MAG: hypothetical protein IJX94_00575, partial [Clostridia bacterium]|nr:hypothetical protein [Clostridia bacterium]